MQKATSEDWHQYYAETAKRRDHGRNDPIELERARAKARERVRLVIGAAGLVTTLAAYVLVLAN